MDLDTEIGSNVQRERERLGVSQQALADVMRDRGWKWSQATVWSIEKGDRPLRLAEALDLAQVLEVDVRNFGQSAANSAISAADRRVSERLHDFYTSADALMASRWALAGILDNAYPLDDSGHPAGNWEHSGADLRLVQAADETIYATDPVARLIDYLRVDLDKRLPGAGGRFREIAEAVESSERAIRTMEEGGNGEHPAEA